MLETDGPRRNCCCHYVISASSCYYSCCSCRSSSPEHLRAAIKYQSRKVEEPSIRVSSLRAPHNHRHSDYTIPPRPSTSSPPPPRFVRVFMNWRDAFSHAPLQFLFRVITQCNNFHVVVPTPPCRLRGLTSVSIVAGLAAARPRQ